MTDHTGTFTKSLYSTSWSREARLHHGTIFSSGQEISVKNPYGRINAIFAFKAS